MCLNSWVRKDYHFTLIKLEVSRSSVLDPSLGVLLDPEPDLWGMARGPVVSATITVVVTWKNNNLAWKYLKLKGPQTVSYSVCPNFESMWLYDNVWLTTVFLCLNQNLTFSVPDSDYRESRGPPTVSKDSADKTFCGHCKAFVQFGRWDITLLCPKWWWYLMVCFWLSSGV